MRRGALLLGCVAAVTAAGCSSGSFVGRRVDNFTAYYNAFYNARTDLRDAVRSIEKTPEVFDRTRYLPVYPVRQGQAQAAKLNDAIKKSSDVLRDHPDSKWTDDALLLIGQSYFYLGQYGAAEQKFREVLTEWRDSRGRPSDLSSDARLWLARSLVAAGRAQAAADYVAESLGREGISRGLAGRLHLLRADVAVQREAWDDAAEALRAGLDGVRDDALRARALFLLGQVEETRGQTVAAAEAFRAAARAASGYDLGYAATVSAARVAGLSGGSADAERLLRRLAADDKNADRLAELAYLRGRIFQAERRGDDARAAYLDALYGGHRDASAVRGRAQYALGTLYRDVFGDYFRAAVHFDSAGTDLATRAAAGERPGTFTREAIRDAADLKTAFGGYARLRTQIAESDSLLALGRLDEAGFRDAVLRIRQERGRLQAEQDRELARRNQQRAFGGTLTELGGNDQRTGPPPTSSAASTPSTSGYLFYLDPVRVRENRLAFAERWGDRPLVPNWRRREAISGTPDAEVIADEGAVAPQVGGTADGLPDLDVSAVPRTPEALARMEAARAEALYSLGGVFLLNLERSDSAAALYRRVIEEAPRAGVAPRAYYALAEVRRAEGDTAAAARLYREVLAAYPDAEFAGRLRERLGEAPPPVSASPDSLAAAEAAYAAASAAWASGDPDVFTRFVAVAAVHRGTPAAAQALLAAGQTLLERAAGDSLAGRRELPADSALLARAGIRPDTTAAHVTPRPTPPPAVALPVPPASDSTGTDSTATDSTAGAVPPAPLVPTVVQEVPVSTPAFRLADLYRSLADLYPNTPYAARAQALLAVLTDGAPPAPSPTAPPPREVAPPARRPGTQPIREQ